MIKQLKLKNKKGQGALEYLLIIGGVLLVAIIIITIVLSTSRSSERQASEAAAQVQQIEDVQVQQAIITNADCNATSDIIRVQYIESVTAGLKKYRFYVYTDPTSSSSYKTNLLDYNATIMGTDFNVMRADINNMASLTDTFDMNKDERYYISVTAIKNNVSSPNSVRFSCTAHD
ncbi:MAG TPA: class III signal peptide-containing protein [Candidatus Diapherotrites archaeon]|nr:class III signal peptide-containing protein [Candidatus Diapherotrites archaeon]